MRSDLPVCLCFRAFSSANKQTLQYIMNENTWNGGSKGGTEKMDKVTRTFGNWNGHIYTLPRIGSRGRRGGGGVSLLYAPTRTNINNTPGTYVLYTILYRVFHEDLPTSVYRPDHWSLTTVLWLGYNERGGGHRTATTVWRPKFSPECYFYFISVYSTGRMYDYLTKTKDESVTYK